MKIFAGEFKGRNLKSPKGMATRPTKGMVREAVFNLCQGMISGAHVLDLFAGSGSIGFEALSRGAGRVVFVEQDRLAIRCIRENLQLLKVEERADWIHNDVSAALTQLGKQTLSFDIIYIDPPYEQVQFLAPPLLKLIETNSLLSNHGLILLEGPSKKEPLIFQSETLQLKETRSFGDTLLYLYKHPQCY